VGKTIIEARGANGAPAVAYGHNDFGEIGIYSAALSDSDLSDLETHLMDQWGII
jgi:hypothetical protein